MRKTVFILTGFAISYSALAQKSPIVKRTPQVDTFFIVDPRDAKYYREHPETRARADADRQLIRNEEYKHTGLQWVSLENAGLEVRNMILKSNPSMMDKLRHHGLQIDIAKTDFDHDGKTDIVFYDWSDGKADGYNYTVVFGKTIKPNRKFFGMVVKPYKAGILVDRAYYVL